MSTKRFRIAFSFAGEKRDYVAQVAAILARCFGEDKILYDKYHEAEFAVFNLGIKLPKLYDEESDLIVPVLCDKYDDKLWTGWEWVHIYGLLTKKDGHRVMHSRFDHAMADGLSPVAGFIELDDKTPHQFATLILERLARNEGKDKGHYTREFARHLEPHTPAPLLRTSIPHNLPTLQPFFGREEELAKIADALDPESRTWGALIDGPGGMGKTSLAVRAAYAVKPEIFHKIVFVSLKTRELDDDGVRDLSGFILSGLSELLGELAAQLGHKDISKAPEEQRPRLLLDALSGTQTLLILDNLESLLKKERDIVFTFVKKLPAGCKAILTSRLRIGSGAEELMLEKLSQDAALQTLAELATHNRELAKTSEAERIVLYRETGGKPLLLRWTAGQIGRGHCLTFTHAIDYLCSCPEGNDPLEFIFGDLVEDFSEAETRALCALTYFTLPVKVEHVWAVANPMREPEEKAAARAAFNRLLKREAPIEEDDAKNARSFTEAEIGMALRSLVNRSLVVPSDEYQAYTLVPLVADFIRHKKPQIVAETGSRMEKRAYALIMENGWQEYDRFLVLDAAWASVAPAIPLFLAGPNASLQQICDALTTFLNFTGRWDDHLALSQQAEVRALAAGDHAKAGWRNYNAGYIHYLRSQADDVLACAERAKTHWARAFPPGSSGQTGTRERAIAIQLLAFGHQLKQDYSAAITAHREAVELNRRLPAESDDVVACLNNLAEAERLSGDLDASERDYLEALQVARSVGDAEGIATCTGNLAGLALNRQDWPGAEAQAHEALQLSEKVGRQELIASNNQRIANALEWQGRGAEGLPYARRAVEIFTWLGMPNFLASAQATLAACEAAAAKDKNQ